MTFYVIAHEGTDTDPHLTLVPGFEIDDQSLVQSCSEHIERLGAAKKKLHVCETGRITLQTGKGDLVHVQTLELTRELKKLHYVFADVVESCGVTLTSPYIRRFYLPHVTLNHVPQPEYVFDRITLSERTRDGFKSHTTVNLN